MNSNKFRYLLLLALLSSHDYYLALIDELCLDRKKLVAENTDDVADESNLGETLPDLGSFTDPETNFAAKHAEMGLSDLGDESYFYSDQYSEVKYVRLITKKGGHDSSVFSIMTRNPTVPVDEADPLEGFKFAGYVTG